jgi:hypothetical protein
MMEGCVPIVKANFPDVRCSVSIICIILSFMAFNIAFQSRYKCKQTNSQKQHGTNVKEPINTIQM